MLPSWLQGYADKQLRTHVDFIEAELSEHGCCDWAWQCRTGTAWYLLAESDRESQQQSRAPLSQRTTACPDDSYHRVNKCP